MRMRRSTMLSMASLAVPHFSTLSDEWYDFRKKVIEHEIRFFLLSLKPLCETFLILRTQI